MVWSKLKKSPLFFKIFRYPKENSSSLPNKSNVNEEYTKALRTKSFIELCGKVEGQIMRTKTLEKFPSSSRYLHLSDCLFEPHHETLTNIIRTSNPHHLLVDYFRAGMEACDMCALLLRGLHQTRVNYRMIKRIIKLTNGLNDGSDYTSNDKLQAIFRDLASFAQLENPLSTISQVHFNEMHDKLTVLLRLLISQCERIRNRSRLIRCCKKVAGSALISAYGALAITLLILAVHSLGGVVVAPALIYCSLGILKKKLRRRKKFNRQRLMRTKKRQLGSQLDVAAKGLYILINDLDTMSRLVMRLRDEIEHSKVVAEMCVRNNNNNGNKREVLLKEVVREFRAEKQYFMEQLEELEEHILLCFLTINRSRRLVVRELINTSELV